MANFIPKFLDAWKLQFERVGAQLGKLNPFQWLVTLLLLPFLLTGLLVSLVVGIILMVWGAVREGYRSGMSLFNSTITEVVHVEPDNQ